MKKVLVSCFPLAVIVFIIISSSSCGKEKGIPPNISFKTGAGYTYKDTTVVHGKVFNLGINATKTGTEALLNSCTITRSVNGGADSTIQQMSFAYQAFSSTYSYIAADSGTVQRYTFSVGKNDGLSNSVSIVITSI